MKQGVWLDTPLHGANSCGIAQNCQTRTLWLTVATFTSGRTRHHYRCTVNGTIPLTRFFGSQYRESFSLPVATAHLPASAYLRSARTCVAGFLEELELVVEQRLVEHGQQGGGAILGEGVQPPPVLAREHHRLRRDNTKCEENHGKYENIDAACEPTKKEVKY